MRVFLTGGSGFIGGHLIRALVAGGHQVTCLARGAGRRRIDAQSWPGVRTVEGEFTTPDAWLAEVAGHDAVINAVGIIRQTPRARFETVHTTAPGALFTAARAAGVKKIIQISALGADSQAQSGYHLSKRAADAFLAGLGVPYLILRPSFVYGPQDQSMTWFLQMAAWPLTPVPGDGRSRVQPVHIDDLTRAVLLGLERSDLSGFAIDVVGAAPLDWNELFDALARRLGKRRARKVHAPHWAMSAIAALTDALSGRGPITGDEWSMLRRGNEADVAPFVDRFGFSPVAFEAGLARRPLSPAEATQSRLSCWRTPLRLSIAFIWLATGLISALVSADQGLDLLRQVGITGPLAKWALFGTSGLEVALGLATLAGWRVRLMGAVQLALMAGFTAILSASMPELWLHPFGPLTKNIPLAAATLLMMAWED